MKKYFYGMLFLLLATTIPAFAQGESSDAELTSLPANYAGPILPKASVGIDEMAYYVIASAEDYEIFRQIVATGNPYANAILTGNITVTKPIGGGDEQFHYRGIFDGQGYTIVVDSLANDSEKPWGLFQFTEPGCVIKNLNVSGIISSEGTYMGSIVGQATGTRIENCSSNITLKNSKSTDARIGGFIGVGYGKNFLKDCSFSGKIESTGKSYGIIGHNPHVLSIENCTWGEALASGDGFIEAPKVTTTSPNGVYVDNLHYTLNKDNRTAILGHISEEVVDGTATYKDALKAIHVPESFIVDGVTYAVTRIGNNALEGSHMEYCYIPKTVTTIDDNAFNNCSRLKFIHIADGESSRVANTDQLYFGHKGKTTTIFKDCPLEKVYIGRDLRWYTDFFDASDEPFFDKDGITDVFFGPCVSRVGNYYAEDARKGQSNELFARCNGIKRVYFMGAEQSLDTKVEVWTDEGMINANDFYLNRTMKTTGGVDSYVTYHDDGIMLNCMNISFGPFVKEIGSYLLGALSDNENVKSVDLSNAFHLETIGEDAFKRCTKAIFNADMSKTNLLSIGKNGFYKCESLNTIRFGTKLQTIGNEAFSYCKNLTYISIPGSVTELGSETFGNCESLLGVKIEDSDNVIERKFFYQRPFDNSKNIASVYVGREIDDNPEYVSMQPFQDSRNTLSSVELGPKVKTVPWCIFYYVAAVKSVSFDYSPEPIRFLNSVNEDLHTTGPGFLNKISSLFIDRKIVDKDNKEITGEKWGTLQETIEFITFGEHVTNVSEGAFANFKHLNNLFIPRSMKTIGDKAFSGNTELNSLVIMGAPTIGVEAFANCTNLETVIVNDGGVKVSKNAFANCNDIKDITLNSDGNTAVGAGDAFSDEAYRSTKLYSTFDTSNTSVIFDKEPWSNFQFHPYKRNHDYTESSAAQSGYYEHASIKHTVNEGQYEAFYAPFQWDSYYFGSDAEIYSLKLINDNFSEEVSENGSLSTHSIKVEAVDISETRTLPLGVYFVKTNHSADDLHATRNLFFENEVYVDNEKLPINNGLSSCFVFRGDVPQYGEPIEEELKWDRYIFEDGVMKLLNGKHFLQSGTISMYSPKSLRDKDIFNIDKNAGATLLTSKKSVPIHSQLEGYATFYNEKYNVLAPTWCEVYVVTGEENRVVSMEQIEDRIITAGQAVIIKTNRPDAIGAEDFMTYVTDASQATELYSRNLLRGVSEDTLVDDICGADGFVYVLSRTSGNSTGFYKYGIGKTLGAGKAYILPSDFFNIDISKSCLFTFNDVANGMGNLTNSQPHNITTSVYDLSGKRINTKQTPDKGIYIIDNKKVVK